MVHRNCCVCHVKLFIKSVSDNYSVDVLGKGRFPWKTKCFNLNYSWGCLPYSIIIVRLLSRVYHFRLRICYPCSFFIDSLGSSTGSLRKIIVYRPKQYKLVNWVLVKPKNWMDIIIIYTCVKFQTFLLIFCTRAQKKN